MGFEPPVLVFQIASDEAGLFFVLLQALDCLNEIIMLCGQLDQSCLQVLDQSGQDCNLGEPCRNRSLAGFG